MEYCILFFKRGRNRNWYFFTNHWQLSRVGISCDTVGNSSQIPSRNNTPIHPIQFNLICIGKKHMKQKHETWYFYSKKINLPWDLKTCRTCRTCYTCDLLAQKSATRACRVRQVRTRETFFWWVILDLDGLDVIWFGWVGVGPKYCLKQCSEIRWYIHIYIYTYAKKDSWVSARDSN